MVYQRFTYSFSTIIISLYSYHCMGFYQFGICSNWNSEYSCFCFFVLKFLLSMRSQLVSPIRIISLSCLSSLVTTALRLSKVLSSTFVVGSRYQETRKIYLAFLGLISKERSSRLFIWWSKRSTSRDSFI